MTEYQLDDHHADVVPVVRAYHIDPGCPVIRAVLPLDGDAAIPRRIVYTDTELSFLTERRLDWAEGAATGGRVRCNACFLADGFAACVAYHTAVGSYIPNANLQCT